jgi:type II secretory pathway pseudopilin PulG
MSIESRLPQNGEETGSIILEVLVAIVILSIMGLALVQSILMSLRTREHAVRTSLAMQVASDSLEEVSATNPSMLSDANDRNDQVTRAGVSFTRLIDVTVNADGSRTIDVSVVGTTTKLGGKANLSVTVIPWEVG